VVTATVNANGTVTISAPGCAGTLTVTALHAGVIASVTGTNPVTVTLVAGVSGDVPLHVACTVGGIVTASADVTVHIP
jgi:hypothetical protein